jgi:hypothetical protein
MPELMAGHFQPQMPQNSFLDRDLNRSLASWSARKRDSSHGRRDFVAVNVKPFGEHRRNFELQGHVILGFGSTHCENGRLAPPLSDQLGAMEATVAILEDG